MSNFKPDDEVLVRARVLRVDDSDETVEVKLYPHEPGAWPIEGWVLGSDVRKVSADE